MSFSAPRVIRTAIGPADRPDVGILYLWTHEEKKSFALKAEHCRRLGLQLLRMADRLDPDGAKSH